MLKLYTVKCRMSGRLQVGWKGDPRCRCRKHAPLEREKDGDDKTRRQRDRRGREKTTKRCDSSIWLHDTRTGGVREDGPTCDAPVSRLLTSPDGRRGEIEEEVDDMSIRAS